MAGSLHVLVVENGEANLPYRGACGDHEVVGGGIGGQPIQLYSEDGDRKHVRFMCWREYTVATMPDLDGAIRGKAYPCIKSSQAVKSDN